MKKCIMWICICSFLLFCSCTSNENLEKEHDFYYDIEQIGSYTNLSFEQPTIIITDEEIEAEIQSSLLPYSSFKNITNRSIQKGDIVYLTYRTIDNSKIGNNVDCEIIIGDGNFDFQFENELIGKTVNNEYLFSILFDNTCNRTEWKNQEITFSVNIRKIEEIIFPELNPSFLQKNFYVDTIDDYNNYIKDTIYNYKSENNKKELTELAMKQIIDNTTFGKEYYTQCEARYNDVINAYYKYADLYNLSLSDVLFSFDMTEKSIHEIAEYNEACAEICQYIIQKENLLPSNNELENLKQAYIEDYGYNTIDEFIADNGEQYLTECIYNLIGLDYIYEHITFY